MDWWSQPIKPMEPALHRQPFDSSAHIFEIKWDGIRGIAFLGEATRLQGKSLRDRTDRFPELATLHRTLKKAKEAILDGEIIVLCNGKPSFARVMDRVLTSNVYTLKRLSRTLPATYVVFDILYLDGRWLTGLPLLERKQILAEVVTPAEHVTLSPLFPDQGIALFDAVCALGLEGIVAKQKTAPYLMGRKSRLWQKIKCTRRLYAVIGGYTPGKSLLLGAYHDDKLHFIGGAGSGLAQTDWQSLSARLVRLHIPRCPFVVPPVRHTAQFWVQPQIVVEVEFLEWTETRTMRAPVILRTVAQPPETCRLDI